MIDVVVSGGGGGGGRRGVLQSVSCSRGQPRHLPTVKYPATYLGMYLGSLGRYGYVPDTVEHSREATSIYNPGIISRLTVNCKR